jgi:peptide/nickel transport system ATP-binding protein
MALMLISHDLAVIARNVRRVMVMYGGLGVEQGPAGEVLHRPMHPYTRGLLAARPRLGAARGERLQTIPGRVPELVDLPTGCPFADRCAHREAVCEAPPSMRPVAEGHEVACLRWETLGPKG